MRYFLPVLPALCILCARLISDLWASVATTPLFRGRRRVGGNRLGLAWSFLHPSGYAGVQQIVATYVLLATALAAIAAGLPGASNRRRALAIVLFGGGVIFR